MGNLDADLAAHLLQLRAAHGERTAVFIVSDHGIHYGKYYDRAQAGPREHALPLAYALLPRSTLARWPKMAAALEANEQRLVSPFDLHGMRDARMRACVHPCLRSHRRAFRLSDAAARALVSRGGRRRAVGAVHSLYDSARPQLRRRGNTSGDAGVGVGVRINFVAIAPSFAITIRRPVRRSRR